MNGKGMEHRISSFHSSAFTLGVLVAALCIVCLFAAIHLFPSGRLISRASRQLLLF
jgi:hypothetical protein